MRQSLPRLRSTSSPPSPRRGRRGATSSASSRRRPAGEHADEDRDGARADRATCRCRRESARLDERPGRRARPGRPTTPYSERPARPVWAGVPPGRACAVWAHSQAQLAQHVLDALVLLGQVVAELVTGEERVGPAVASSSASFQPGCRASSSTASTRRSRSASSDAGRRHDAAPVGELQVHARLLRASGASTPSTRSALVTASTRTSPASTWSMNSPTPVAPNATLPPSMRGEQLAAAVVGDVVDVGRVRRRPPARAASAAGGRGRPGRSRRRRGCRPGRPSRPRPGRRSSCTASRSGTTMPRPPDQLRDRRGVGRGWPWTCWCNGADDAEAHLHQQPAVALRRPSLQADGAAGAPRLKTSTPSAIFLSSMTWRRARAVVSYPPPGVLGTMIRSRGRFHPSRRPRRRPDRERAWHLLTASFWNFLIAFVLCVPGDRVSPRSAALRRKMVTVTPVSPLWAECSLWSLWPRSRPRAARVGACRRLQARVGVSLARQLMALQMCIVVFVVTAVTGVSWSDSATSPERRAAGCGSAESLATEADPQSVRDAFDDERSTNRGAAELPGARHPLRSAGVSPARLASSSARTAACSAGTTESATCAALEVPGGAWGQAALRSAAPSWRRCRS